jgi:16S rRNA (guanine966-N2)-methyltransferase
MRIIAGEWRGRAIDAPAGHATRPTADRLRETLFSMLASRLGSFENLRVADLFAGSGALGLESLSRGAASATFVERDPAALAAIRRNVEKLQAADRVSIIPGSALTLPKAEPFDLIFADPPYATGSGEQVINSVRNAQWLARGGWLSLETARSDELEGDGFLIDAVRDVGKSRLTLLRFP